jgi:hypothetical protein
MGFRDKDKDYGIDCEVELFDEIENSTALLFYAQLKATASMKESKIFKVDLKSTHFRSTLCCSQDSSFVFIKSLTTRA